MVGGINGSSYGSNYGYSAYGAYPATDASESAKINPFTGQEEKIRPEETEKAANPDEVKKAGRQSAPEDCETCKNRKYQDGSDEANVSFKTASKIAPGAVASAVRAHEGQHVANAYKKAAQAENAKVVAANVTIHTNICPECGKTYVSGGTTQTAIKYTNESNPYQQNKKAQDAVSFRGANVNYAV